jgi:S-adenosylmethionine:tRNA ribosyltransferase-isomerase
MSAFTFELPQQLIATAPPERRGLNRDQVRLLVIDRKTHSIAHSQFNEIGRWLLPGDLLVLNSSRTIPASLQGHNFSSGQKLEIRLAEHLQDDSWLALLLCKNSQGECHWESGMLLHFGPELSATVLDQSVTIPRIWRIRFSRTGSELIDSLYKIGEPVRYEYVSAPWNLSEYQTIYAMQPGSAEMPSAGRAFTWKILLDLKQRGINTTFLTLHTGLSSYLDDELDQKDAVKEEEYFISDHTAEEIEKTRHHGGRIIAVGTTVVKAIESAVDRSQNLHAGHGYTKLHITGNTKLQIVNGLLTGLHEPQASHLDLLSAFLPTSVIESSYKEAIRNKYLWHEFGDLNLIA